MRDESTLTADQWRRLKVYCQQKTRSQLRLDSKLAQRLRSVATDGNADNTRARPLSPVLVAEALKFAKPDPPR